MPATAAEQTPPGAGARRLMIALFLLSGSAALIYQIVWVRALELVFGVSLYATAAVVAAYMGGLALGSVWFGRLVDRVARPMRLFAMLQGGIALFALLFPTILDGLRWVYVGLYPHLGDHPALMSGVRGLLAFTVLLIPTSLMGGTLPVITRAMTSGREHVGRDVASLYSANNLGAFIGCVLTGYVFLEALGIPQTTWLAVGLNVVVMAVAWALQGKSAAVAEDIDDAPAAAALSVPLQVALWVFAIEGVTSLIYQMAWVRTLVFFVSTNIYGVTAIVATFLAGLALGAWISRRFVDRLRNPWFALGGIEVGIALSALLTLVLLPHMLGIHFSVVQAVLGDVSKRVAISAGNFGLTLVVIAIPTAFMGATLPVLTRIYITGRAGLGRRMGLLGCLDTVGSVAGALAAGFLLIPLLGAQRTIALAAVINLALAAWIFAVDPTTKRSRFRRPALYITVATLLATSVLLISRPRPVIESSFILTDNPMLELISWHDDHVASVAVVEKKGHGRRLYVNDEAVGSSGRMDRYSHEIEIHQTLLLHPQPERMLTIGVGLGMGVAAALSHDVKIDAVELSAGVIELNTAFDAAFDRYRMERGGTTPLQDPDVRVRVEDGRNYVLGTAERYDVVHVGGFHPLRSSSAAGFFTRDFLEQSKRVLRPGGHVAMWLPTHGIPVDDFKIIVRTFVAAFPHATVWHKHAAGCLLFVGSLTPLTIDYQRFVQTVARAPVRRHLAGLQISDPHDLLDSYCWGPETMRKVAGRGPLQTDAHPLIEYHSLLAETADTTEVLAMLRRYRQPVVPVLRNMPSDRRDEILQGLSKWFEASQMLLVARIRERADTPEATADAYKQASDLNPDDQVGRFSWARWMASYMMAVAERALAEGKLVKGREVLKVAHQTCPDCEVGAEALFRLQSLDAAAP